MKPTPKGWPQISSALYYSDPAAAIDWLCKAFGFQVRIKVEGEGGAIVHSELEFGTGLIMVSGLGRSKVGASPASLDGKNTQTLFVYVDDVEAHCVKAREAGAKVLTEPKTSDYGEDYWTDRSCELEDLEGHKWWFAQRLKG